MEITTDGPRVSTTEPNAALEGGDEHDGMTKRYQFAIRPRTGRPAGTVTRHGSLDGWKRLRETRDGTDDPPFAARVFSGSSVGAATLLGERAATRGRSATERGEEQAGVKRARHPFE